MRKVNCTTRIIILFTVMTISLIATGSHAKQIQLRYANAYIPWAYEHAPMELKGPETFKEIIEKQSAGKVKIDIYPSGQLFKDKDMTAAIPEGLADFGMTVASQWMSLIPSAAFFALPFIFENQDHFYNTFEGEAGELLSDAFEDKNLKLLGIWVNEPLVILTKSKPITGPDLTGFKLRAFGKVPAWFCKAANGSPMFMSVSEIYLALKTGTVDGLFTSTYGMAGYKLFEVTQFVTGIPNWFVGLPIVMNLAKWNSLSPEIQRIIAGAAREVMDRARKENWVKKHADESFEIAIDKGNMIRHEVSAREYEEWSKSKEEIKKEFIKITGDLGEKLLRCAENSKI